MPTPSMCDTLSTSRPWNPAVRRDGLSPASFWPTATTRHVWHTDIGGLHSKVPLTYRATPTPVIQLRQLSSTSTDLGGSHSESDGTESSEPSISASSGGPSDSSSSSQSQDSPPPSSVSSSDSQSQSQSDPDGPSSSSLSSSSSVSSSSDDQQSSSSQSSSSSLEPSTSSSSPLTTSSSAPSSSLSSPSPSPSPSSTPSPTPSPPPSSPSSNSSTAPPTSSSSPSITNGVESTITSVFVTEINGTSTTVTSLIPTMLSGPPSDPMSPGTRKAIITGSAIGGTVFLIIIAALVIFCKRSSRLRLNYKKLRVFSHKKRDMLLDDDEDYDLGDPPGMHRLSERYRDNPYAPSMDSRASSRTQGPSAFPAASVPGSTSPHLLGLRASESGSIFREAVWPPPGEQSRLVDPLISASNSVDLGRIVGDVMGPTSPNAPSTAGQPSASQSSSQPSVAIVTGVGTGVHSRQSSATRLLSSNFQYPEHPEPPEYDYDDVQRNHELEFARAQSPDSQLYNTRPGPLRVANAGPDSPSSQTFTPPGTPKVKNWLDRSPKNLHKEPAPAEEPPAEQVVMGEAL